jgi:hypothetical protein
VFARSGGASPARASAAARIIYFFGDYGMPLYLLAVYAKNEKTDLSVTEKAAMRKFVKALVREHRARSA